MPTATDTDELTYEPVPECIPEIELASMLTHFARLRHLTVIE